MSDNSNNSAMTTALSVTGVALVGGLGLAIYAIVKAVKEKRIEDKNPYAGIGDVVGSSPLSFSVSALDSSDPDDFESALVAAREVVMSGDSAAVEAALSSAVMSIKPTEWVKGLTEPTRKAQRRLIKWDFSGIRNRDSFLDNALQGNQNRNTKYTVEIDPVSGFYIIYADTMSQNKKEKLQSCLNSFWGRLDSIHPDDLDVSALESDLLSAKIDERVIFGRTTNSRDWFKQAISRWNWNVLAYYDWRNPYVWPLISSQIDDVASAKTPPTLILPAIKLNTARNPVIMVVSVPGSPALKSESVSGRSDSEMVTRVFVNDQSTISDVSGKVNKNVKLTPEAISRFIDDALMVTPVVNDPWYSINRQTKPRR